MARLLEIDWRETDLPIQEREGYGTTYLPLSALADAAGGSIQMDIAQKAQKPLFIYFYGGSTDDEKLEKIEQKMFGKDDLAIASKFYRCVRIDADQIEDQKVRARFAKKTPTFYILDGTGRQLFKKTGKLSANSIASAMDKSYKAIYGVKLAPRIKKFNDFLDRLEKADDKVAGLAAKLNDAEERAAKRDTSRNAGKVEEIRAEHQAATEALEKINQEKEDLLAPPAKGEKAVARRG